MRIYNSNTDLPASCPLAPLFNRTKLRKHFNFIRLPDEFFERSQVASFVVRDHLTITNKASVVRDIKCVISGKRFKLIEHISSAFSERKQTLF